jgi:hypothetical protein
MKNTGYIKLVLMVTGVLTGIVGAAILLVPDAFYASYEITLPDSASLRSELKGTGSLLFLAGGLMLAGGIQRPLQTTALIVASGTYTALVIGRLISLVIDGVPSTAILAAWALEALLLCLILIAGLFDRKNAFAV